MTLGVIVVSLVTAATAAPARAAKVRVRRGFTARVDGRVSPYRLHSAFVLPGHRLRVAVDGAGGGFALRAPSGRVERGGPASWIWHAPAEPGLHSSAP